MVAHDAQTDGPGVDAAARTTWFLTFVVVGLLTVGWALVTPPLGSPDEPAHIRKAAAVGQGDLSTAFRWVGPTTFGQTIPITTIRVPEGYVDLSQHQCYLNHRDVPAACAELSDETGPVVPNGTYVGTYQPTYYAMVGWLTRGWAPDPAVLLMRILSGLVAAALVASAAVSLRGAGGRGFTAVGLVAGLTPMALMLMGTVNPNGFEAAAAVGVWAALLAVADGDGPPGTRLLVRLAVASVLLVGARPLSPGFLALILVTVAALTLDRERARVLLADTGARVTAAVVGVATLASTAFVLVNGSLSAVITHIPEESHGPAGRAVEAIGDTGKHLEQAVALLGWLGQAEVTLPDTVWRGWLVVLAGLLVAALVVSSWRRRVVLVALLGAVLALPVVANVTSDDVRWQGRYVLPLLVGLPILCGWQLDRSPRVAARLRRLVPVAVAVLLAGAGFVAHQTLLSRSVVGWGRGPFSWTRGGPWTGPLTPGVLTLGAAVAAVGVVALVLAASRPPAPAGASDDPPS